MHLPVLTSSWPFDPLAPEVNSVFWSILLSTLLLSAGVTQGRDSQSESNYRDNYDCDLVWPGFVFKWTNLPWALEMHLLRTQHELRDSFVTQSLCIIPYSHMLATRHILSHCAELMCMLILLVSSMHPSFSFVLIHLNKCLIAWRFPLELGDHLQFDNFQQNIIVMIWFYVNTFLLFETSHSKQAVTKTLSFVQSSILKIGLCSNSTKSWIDVDMLFHSGL